MTAIARDGPSPNKRGSGEGADLRSLARGGALNIVGAGAAAGANLGVVVVIAWAFDKQVAGVFFAATSVFLLGEMIARLGTQTGLVYFISRFRALDTAGRIRSCLKVALIPVLTVAVFVATIYFLLSPWIAGLAVHGDSGPFTQYLRLLALFVPIAAVAQACLAATRGFRTMRPTVLVENIGRSLTQLALITAVATVGASALLALAWAGPYLVAGLLAAGWLVTLVRRYGHPAGGSGDDSAPQPADGLVAAFWRYSAPRAVAGIAQLGLQRFDIILVAAILGPAEAAIYTVATRFLVVGQLGNAALAQAVQPQLGEVLARDNRTEARTLYQTATAWLVLIMWPFYLVCIHFAATLMSVFGQGYHSGTGVVVILALTMLMATSFGMVDIALVMAGRTTWNLIIVVVALAVAVGLDLLLIPRFGIIGAAVGWSAAIVAKNVLSLAGVRRSLRIHPFGAGTFNAAILAGVCFGVLPVAARLILGVAPIVIGVAVLVGAPVYVYGCWRWRGVLRLDTLAALRARGRLAGT